MAFFLNLRVGLRLQLAFAVILLLLLALVGVAALHSGRLQKNVEHYNARLLPSFATLKGVLQGVDDARQADWQVVFIDDEKVRAQSEKVMMQARQAVGRQMQAFSGLVDDAQGKRLYDEATAKVAAYWAVQDKLVAAAQARQSDPLQGEVAQQLVAGDASRAYDEVRQAIQTWWDYNVKQADAFDQSSQATYTGSLWQLGAMALVAMVLGVALALALTRSITAPLGHAVKLAHAVAAGDLTHHVQAGSRRDEFGDLLQALGSMTDSLSTIVHDVTQGTDAIAAASREIAMGNSDLSNRTEQQASSLQETAASVEQMAGAVSHNAQNAQQASQLAAEASRVAEQGGQAVQEVVSTMNGIQSSSRRMSDIIGVIDGIAFQTNILALNAAVEAARAGEQGRGFAVVAGEVRSLAGRSAEAAREIRSLITSSVEQVESGHARVNEAGKTMAEVVAQVDRVRTLIGEITGASGEQSRGISQINSAVGLLDQAVQQNAALVEQTAAAAQSLQQQAGRLVDAVRVFRVTDPAGSGPLLLGHQA